jgi:hypothetical protein
MEDRKTSPEKSIPTTYRNIGKCKNTFPRRSKITSDKKGENQGGREARIKCIENKVTEA